MDTNISSKVIKTLHLKLKFDSRAFAWLSKAAREVNQVWNKCNEISSKAWKDKEPLHQAHVWQYRLSQCEVGKENKYTKAMERIALDDYHVRQYYWHIYGKADDNGQDQPHWYSGFDMSYKLKGLSKTVEKLPQASIIAIGEEHATRRAQFKKSKLRWRVSEGARKSLEWIPFKAQQIKQVDGRIVFAGKRWRHFAGGYNLADPKLRLKSGSFARDGVGDWWLNVAVEMPSAAVDLPAKAVGIDLGLKDAATTSDGESLGRVSYYRDIEQRIAQAQRRGHKRQAKRLHRTAANRRNDALHKFSARLVRDYGAIYVGDVSSTKLVKTNMAKSVLDSGWGMLKAQLQYKGRWAGNVVEVVKENLTTQRCSNCGQVTGPKGLRQLGVRRWVCIGCGAEHDRDQNAAINILKVGLGQEPPKTGTRLANNVKVAIARRGKKPVENQQVSVSVSQPILLAS